MQRNQSFHHHPSPSPAFFAFFTFHSCLSRRATQFIPIGTDQLHLSSERISSKSCYIPKQINRVFLCMIKEEFSNLYARLFEPCACKSLKYLAFQCKIRKLLQGSTPHALNITGHSSLNPRLKHKQNLLSIYLTLTPFSSASHEILCEQTYS